MAEVGELTWIAEIKEVADAKREASEVTDDLEGMAEVARETDDAVKDVDDSAGGLGKSFGTLGKTTGLVNGMLGLLNSSLIVLILQFTGLRGKVLGTIASLQALYGVLGTGGLLGVLSTIGTKLGAFASWVAAGSAGALAFAAALGAVIGLIGVWILKITGVLDVIGDLGSALADRLPGWATDAILAVISIFAGGLAVLGGVILGFMEGGLSGAIERGSEVLFIFVDAWVRLAERVREVAGDLLDGLIEWAGNVKKRVAEGLTGAFDTFLEGMSNTWDAAVELKDDLVRWASDLASQVSSTVTNAFTGGWNAAVPDRLDIPEISIGGQEIGVNIAGKYIGGELPSVSVGGQSLDLPQMKRGGMVESAGAVELHDDEMVLPADISRGVIDAIRRFRAGGGSGGGAGDGSGGDTIIEQVLVEIGDQSLDIRDLDRFTLQTLAELIGDEMGDALQEQI